MNPKCCSLLGLAMRAGKLKLGEDAVLQVVRNKQAQLVLIANDASAATYKKIHDKCSHYNVKLQRLFARAELGQCIGRAEIVSIAIVDSGFAQAILSSLENEKEVDRIEKKDR